MLLTKMNDQEKSVVQAAIVDRTVVEFSQIVRLEMKWSTPNIGDDVPLVDLE